MECTWNSFHKEYLHDVLFWIQFKTYSTKNLVWKLVISEIFVVVVYIAAGILGEVDEGSNYKAIEK